GFSDEAEGAGHRADDLASFEGPLDGPRIVHAGDDGFHAPELGGEGVELFARTPADGEVEAALAESGGDELARKSGGAPDEDVCRHEGLLNAKRGNAKRDATAHACGPAAGYPTGRAFSRRCEPVALSMASRAPRSVEPSGGRTGPSATEAV